MVDTAAAAPGANQGSATTQIKMNATQALETATTLYSRGRFADAEAMARQVIKFRPNDPDAYNILAVSLSAQGKNDEAADLMRQAVTITPQGAVLYANLGEIERQRGRLDEARKALEKAIALDPGQAAAHNSLGIVSFDEGKYEAARDCYRNAVEANPRYSEAHNNLGNVSRMLGRTDEALDHYHKALQHREMYPEAYNNLGTLLRDQGKLAEAEHALRRAISQNYKYVDAHNNLATVFFLQNKDMDALRALGDALRVDDNHPVTLTLVARVQQRRGALDLAEQAAERALAANRQNPEALVVLGQLHYESDRYEGAIKLLEEALEQAPNFPDARNFYGVTLKALGRLEEGKEQLLKAIELNPHNYGSYANLNDLVDFKNEPTLVANMEQIFSSDGPDAPHLMALHFGFAKALEDLGDYPRALDHFIKGGKHKRALLEYNEEETFGFFSEVKRMFGEELFRNRPFGGFDNDRLVFIVGMPRSGSTLVEQILSAHPDVFGAGEVKFLARAMGQIRDRFPWLNPFPQIVEQMEDFHWETMGSSYLNNLLPLADPTTKKITDKLLTNFFFVGMINLLFPRAKIIHTLRNPVDTCLSAFTKLFKDDMPHSYEFGELGRYYLQYRSLMDHWHAVLPKGVMMDVVYEDVVADVGAKARDLVDFIGLEWDPACVEFYNSKRPVKTASLVQVRKPVYTGSVERWRRYGPALQPLIDALGYVPDDAPAAKAPKAAASKKKSGGKTG